MSNEAVCTLEFIASNDGNPDQAVAKRALELIRAFDAFDTQAEAPLAVVTTQWHPHPQWLLLAYDYDKKADREFALKDFGQPEKAVDMGAVKHLISAARAFLRYFNPFQLAEDKSQQWQSLSHECDVVERAINEKDQNG